LRLGYSIPNNQGVEDVHDLIGLGVFAQAHGYDSVWVSEHLFHATYVEKRLGDRPYHDPLTVLTALACVTQTVRLGTSVLVLPWHHPARLGKTIATLDHLSGGRVDLGIGVAVTEDEFENLGIDFRSRGERTDDTLGALAALFSQATPTYEGDYWRFEGLRFEPKPRQDPLPIHVGGGSQRALLRVAEHGHGWHALGKSPSEMASDLTKLRALLDARGRSLDDIVVSVRAVLQFVDEPWDREPAERRSLRGTESEIRAVLEAYRDAGVHEVIIDPNTRDVSANERSLERVRALWPR
jgi:probable F420-dependent oxidoreductase